MDSTAALSALGVLQIVQDGVTEMMGRLNIDGVTVKKKYNALWAFTKNKTEIFKSIPWSDDLITVTSFISVITRATICVDVSVRDNGGDLCAYSRIEMCPLDISTMRIRKVESVGGTNEITAEPPENEITFSRLEDAEYEKIDTVTVRSTNIDMSQHTNNVEYMRFIFNTYPTERIKKTPIRSVEIKYINQTYENDVLDIYKSASESADMFLIKSAGKDVLKCAVTF